VRRVSKVPSLPNERTLSSALRMPPRTVRLLLLVMLVFSRGVMAQPINEIMRDAGDTMLRVLPTLYEESPDRILLLENLVRLDYLFKQVKPHFQRQQAGSQVTYGLLQERLAEAIRFGDQRNVNLMRNATIDAFSLCAGCHTQDKHAVPAFGVSKLRELDAYLVAEFSFLTRDYEAALISLSNYLGSDERTARRDANALDRVLVITAEVYADPPLAVQTLGALRPQFDSDSYERRRLDAWLSVLGRLVEEKHALQSPLALRSVGALDRFLENEWPALRATMSIHEQEAYWVVIRGQLNQLMTAGSRDREIPVLLYWLAVSDRAVHYRFYDSMSRSFLERCIESYPRNPVAVRCLKEYEMLVLASFSGSGGTSIPDEVRDRVETLRQRIYSDQ
jgi:hypothetical protein